MPRELEQPLIRPPSESQSVLVRLTRGCKWNRCRFCGIYPALGEPEFSVRPTREVLKDIDRLHEIMPSARTAFVGDADPLQAGVEAFSEVALYLRKKFTLHRLTCYARASTLYTLKAEAIRVLAAAGLNRVHMGLESGDPDTLRFHKKGQTPAILKAVGLWLKEAGIEVSLYALLGMAGREGWEKHIRETARVVNESAPEFLRLRRLWIYGGDELMTGNECPLKEEVRDGRFVPQTPEGTVRELRRLIESLDDSIMTRVISDHANNYFHVEGIVRADKTRMIREIDSFLALPASNREAHYRRVGSHI